MGRGAGSDKQTAGSASPRSNGKKDRLCLVYGIAPEVRDQIQAWAASLPWGECAELQDPRKYHVTAIFSFNGLADEGSGEWVAARSADLAKRRFKARVAAVEAFTPQPGEMTPIVLRLDAPELIAANEKLMDEAEERGLQVSRFPGGYKPHITVGYNPGPFECEPPEIKLEVGELAELSDYYVKTGYKSSER